MAIFYELSNGMFILPPAFEDERRWYTFTEEECVVWNSAPFVRRQSIIGSKKRKRQFFYRKPRETVTQFQERFKNTGGKP